MAPGAKSERIATTTARAPSGRPGPHRLWRIIEDTHAQGHRFGQPGWNRFGLTVTPEGQSIWLDTPDCVLDARRGK
jgi:hypothetical protein